MVNARAVRILLECILVALIFVVRFSRIEYQQCLYWRRVRRTRGHIPVLSVDYDECQYWNGGKSFQAIMFISPTCHLCTVRTDSDSFISHYLSVLINNLWEKFQHSTFTYTHTHWFLFPSSSFLMTQSIKLYLFAFFLSSPGFYLF